MVLQEISEKRKRELENIASNVVSGIATASDFLNLDTEELLQIMLLLSAQIERFELGIIMKATLEKPTWTISDTFYDHNFPKWLDAEIARIGKIIKEQLSAQRKNVKDSINAITAEIVERTKRETENPE